MPLRLAALFCLVAASVSAADADLILHNGKIVTVDAKFSVAQAVAVSGGRIAAVGSDAAVLKEYRGASTRVIDLQGRTVLPGLIDAHMHPLEAALSEYRRPLPVLDSIPAVQRYIRERAAVTPQGEWIVVPRTFPTRLAELRMPVRTDLDVAGEHPVMFDASYVVIVNSYALRMCGIGRDTPDPPRGEIVRDASGEPNGILKNARSLLKGVRADAPFSDSERFEALAKLLALYRAAGLTTIGDGSVDEMALYRKLKGAGRLPVRVVGTWWLNVARPTGDLLAEIRSASFTTNTGDDWIKYGAFKVNFDGGMTIGTAYQRAPYGPFGKQLYGKTKPDDRGQLFAAPEKYLEVFRAALDKGWAVSAHTQGGAAVDLFLETLETLNREHSVASSRSHWIHASFQSPDAIRRARRLGILADVQPAWLYLDAPALEKVFGYDGLRYFFPLRSYIDAGVIVAGGSDHMIGHDKDRAVNPYNPFLGLWNCVARKTVRGRVLHPEQRITRQEALKMYTIWAAYRMFSEKSIGSIEPGKLADMVVTDRDYLTCAEDDIRRISPVHVIVAGEFR